MLKRTLHGIGAHSRKILAWEIFVFFLVYLALAATLATSYQQCAADRESAYSRQEQSGPKENAAAFIMCEIATIDANSALLTAVATVFIAAFTLTLWLATTDQGCLTREAIDEAKISSEHELRAYIGFETEQGKFVDQAGPSVKYQANLWIVNYGKIPSTTVRFIGALDVVQFPIPKNHKFDLDWSKSVINGPLFPGQRQEIMTIAERQYGVTEIQAIQTSNGKRLCLYIGLEYSDGFGNQKFTYLCRTIIFHGADRSFITERVHNSAT